MSDGILRAVKGGRFLLVGFLLLLLLLLVGRWGVVLYVDLLWFSTLGLADVFWTRVYWEWGARVLAGVVTGGLVWVNLRIVARTFQGIQIRRRLGDLVIQEQLPRTYVRWGILFAAVFVGLWFGIAVPQGTGLRGMLLLNAESWGQPDPIFGRDPAFYVFVLPVFQGLITFGLVLSVFLAALSAAGYTATGAINWENGRVTVDPLPRAHLGVLAGAFVLLLAFRFNLAPYDLLLSGNSGVQGIFGYADHEARVPGYRMVAFVALATAGAVFWGAWRRRLLPIAVGAIALTVGALGLVEAYPALVQRFQVQPNELDRETPYIQDAVQHTREGFGLADFTRARLDYTPPNGETWEQVYDRLSRLPVWTENTLLTTFRQVEARYEYYDFHEVAFDRYPTGDGVEPVAVSVREVNPSGIPDPNWQNLHLRGEYISGVGAVAGQLHRHTPEGRLPMFLTAIPPEYRPGPEVPEGVDLDRPSVYVGSQPQLHAVIVPSSDSLFLAPDGSPGTPGVDYPRGILMGSLGRSLALAWRFQDANLLLASEVDDESRLVFRRQVAERVRAIAPFLYLPEAPYPVIAEGRLVWMLEAFTLSRSYPLSRMHQIPGQRLANYLRNSVKVTVDAVTGETRLYVADPDDPIIQAYWNGLPSLFRDMDEMPEALRRHVRYSQYYLDVQSQVLTRFHQEHAPVFHGQQDRWSLATQLGIGSQTVEYRPEYSILTLPGESEESYVLSTLFVPAGRQNLASFVAARWNQQGGPELMLWDVPVETQFRGPRQIEAMIEQDPQISQQFALWRQAGSQVWTGHLHLVPVGTTLLYMEPIFLAADADAIPEIQRFVVSDGDRVVMAPTLEGAVAALSTGMEGITQNGERLESAGTDPEASMRTTFDASRALGVLERAEASLRAGDWEAFGQGLQELRSLLGREAEPAAP